MADKFGIVVTPIASHRDAATVLATVKQTDAG
jgi:hypothetical protein